ncbi:MAG: type III pantothenate kinase [Gemmatimonadales bacterium]|nr:type III pantothenate kinase [Gemmatimonadales bacterium]
MKALLIDAGNSKIRVKIWPGVARGNAGSSSRDLDTGPDREGVEPLEIQAEFSTSGIVGADKGIGRVLASLREENGNPQVVLVSVVPAVTKILKVLWKDLTVVDHLCNLPFTSLVPDMASVGPDRICNVAAAMTAGLSDAVIVDAGTATTFDVLSEGVFLGGLIAPGMAFASRQLGEIAARLEPVPFVSCPLEPGKDTQSAMSGGAWHTGIGGVETVIAGLQKDRPGLVVILTGGLGHHLTAPGRILDPDWTLRGAAQLAGLT